VVDIRQVNHSEPVKGQWQVPQGDGVPRDFNLTVGEEAGGLKVGGE